MAWRAATTASALLIAAALGACSKASRPHVERLAVQSYEGRDVLGMTETELKTHCAQHLERAGFVMLKESESAPEGAGVWRLTLAAEAAEPDPEEGAVVRVGAVLTLRPKGGDDGFDVETREKLAAKSNSVDDLQGAAREAMEKALARAAVESRASIDLERLTDDEVAGRLKDKRAGVREAALRALARRHHHAALSPLLERLGTDDLGEIRRTMGMLVELKDPAAVPALIDASRAKDTVVQREIVFALGAIGGDEAEAYLYVVAQGHDDPLVRASAEQALDELKSRRPHQKEKP